MVIELGWVIGPGDTSENKIDKSHHFKEWIF